MLDNRLPLIHGYSYTDLDLDMAYLDDIYYEEYMLNVLRDTSKNTRQTEIITSVLTRCISKDSANIFRSFRNKSVYTEMCYVYIPINKRKEVRRSVIVSSTFVYSLQ